MFIVDADESAMQYVRELICYRSFNLWEDDSWRFEQNM